MAITAVLIRLTILKPASIRRQASSNRARPGLLIMDDYEMEQ